VWEILVALLEKTLWCLYYLKGGERRATAGDGTVHRLLNFLGRFSVAWRLVQVYVCLQRHIEAKGTRVALQGNKR
jgi:hypothetical protein